MRILHVEDFFHPDAGYDVNLLSRLQQLDGHQVTVVTARLEKMPGYLTAFFGKDDIEARDQAFTRDTGARIVRVPIWGFASGRVIFRFRIFKIISELRPDVVAVHGADTLAGMTFTLASRLLGYPIVLDCHMLEMASRNPFKNYFRTFYRKFIAPIIVRRNIPFIRVVDSDFVEKCLGVPLKQTDLLSFGTDASFFKPNADVRGTVRLRHGINVNAFLVLYAGKLDESKGGHFLAKAMRERFPEAAGKKVEILIIGNSDGKYGKLVDEELSKSENTIIRLPTQRYMDLAQYYQSADLVIFPKQCSVSFFEAQACGVPVLFEENEINNQRSLTGGAMTFIPDSIGDFREKLLGFMTMDEQEYLLLSQKARSFVTENYNYVPVSRKFTNIVRRARVAWLRKVISPTKILSR